MRAFPTLLNQHPMPGRCERIEALSSNHASLLLEASIDERLARLNSANGLDPPIPVHEWPSSSLLSYEDDNPFQTARKIGSKYSPADSWYWKLYGGIGVSAPTVQAK